MQTQAAPGARSPGSGWSSDSELSARNLRERGNTAFREGRYEDALAAYTQAAAKNPLDSAVLCNRAEAHLRLSKFGQAWADSLMVLERPTPLLTAELQLKARLRFIKACIGLQYFQQARQHISILIADPDAGAVATAARALLESLDAQEAKAEADMRDLVKKLVLAEGAHGKANKPKATDMQYLARQATAAPVTWTPPALSVRTAPGGPRDPEVLLPKLRTILAGWPLIEPRHGEYGFGLFAKREIRRGTTVYVDDTYVCAHPDPRRCHHCCARASRPVPCKNGACVRVFCSPACRDAASALYHVAPLCGSDVSEVDSKVASGVTASSRFVLLAIKLLGAAIVTRNKAGGVWLPARPADVPPVDMIWRRTDAGQPFTLTTVVSHLWLLVRHLTRAKGDGAILDPALDLDWMLQAYALIAPNAVCINAPDGGGDLLRGGVALMLGGTFFNHACNSNVEYSSNVDESPRIGFRAQRKIAAGEELTISYVESSAPYQARQDALLGQYGFRCKCRKCAAEAPADAAGPGGPGDCE